MRGSLSGEGSPSRSGSFQMPAAPKLGLLWYHQTPLAAEQPVGDSLAFFHVERAGFWHHPSPCAVDFLLAMAILSHWLQKPGWNRVLERREKLGTRGGCISCSPKRFQTAFEPCFSSLLGPQHPAMMRLKNNKLRNFIPSRYTFALMVQLRNNPNLRRIRAEKKCRKDVMATSLKMVGD